MINRSVGYLGVKYTVGEEEDDRDSEEETLHD